MSQPDETDVVDLTPVAGPDQIDYRKYAGQYIAYSEDDQRVAAHAETIEELFALLDQLDQRGERYIIGGFVPTEWVACKPGWQGRPLPTFEARFARFPLPFGLPSALGGILNVFRPVIPARAYHPTQPRRSRPVALLVDSGADFCIFPDWLAHGLGVTLAGVPAAPLNGAGGSMVARFCPLMLQIGGLGQYYRWELQAGFVTHTTPIFRQGVWTGVLGQIGGLDQFRLTFDYCAGLPRTVLTNCQVSLPVS